MAVRKRLIVVGLGSIGRRHARILAANLAVEVEICDANPEALKRAREEIGDVRNFLSFSEALDSRPDVMLIATPPAEHADQVVAALDRDIHVLCEKPMSDTLAGARRMLEASARSRAILSIGFMMHFRPGIVRLKELVESGHLGRILQFRYHMGTYVTLVNSVSRYQESLFGALFMDYAHQPDLAYWLLGKRPKGVYVIASQGGDIELSSNPNSGFMLLDYEEPLIACISLNYLQMPQRDDCEIIGDRGWVFWDITRQTLRIGTRAGTSPSESSVREEVIPDIGDGIYSREHERFLNATEGTPDPSSPASEAIVSMEIIDAALRSIKVGQRIEV